MASAHPAAEIEALLAAQGLYPACRTAPSEIRRLFTAQDVAADRQHRLANEYCSSCPLKSACLQFGVSERWNHGIYGGTWVAGGQPLTWDELAARRKTGSFSDRSRSAADYSRESSSNGPQPPRPDWDRWEASLLDGRNA